jgi:hypothetical protein
VESLALKMGGVSEIALIVIASGFVLGEGVVSIASRVHGTRMIPISIYEISPGSASSQHTLPASHGNTIAPLPVQP